jgi:hypothetical protein
VRPHRRRRRARPALPFEPMKALQAVAQVLQRPHLRRRERPRIQRRQPQFADPLGRAANGEDGRCLGRHPGGERRERRQVVVDRRRRQALVDQCPLPCQPVAAQAGADAVMAIRFMEETHEAVEVQGDFLRHCRGAYADHGQRQVARRPGGQPVRNLLWEATRDRLHLSGSEIREIGKGFADTERLMASYSLRRRGIPGSASIVAKWEGEGKGQEPPSG